MSFNLPDLIIESVIREGLDFIKSNINLIDNIFGSLASNYNQAKYGQNEIDKLKDLILKKQIYIVHSFYDAEGKEPAISIQLGQDSEDRQTTHLDDFEDDTLIPITDPIELQNLIKINNITIFNYNEEDGIIYLEDSIDLTQIHKNDIFVDASDNEFIIKGVSDEEDNKFVLIEPNSDLDINNLSLIKSSLNYKLFEQRGILSDVQIVIGVHSKSALFAKYLYILVKYFILSQKKSLIERNFIVSTFQGSDFTKNLAYHGDMVFTRFLTINGKIEDSWKADEIKPIDNIEVVVKVEKDQATTENLDLQDMSIQVSE